MDVEQFEQPVSTIMSSPVRTVEGDLPVAEVAAVLWNQGIGAVVVVDGGIEGIVTEADVVRSVAAGHDAETMSVAQLMTTSVVTVDASASVADATELMQEHDVKKLPVTDDGDLVGIVTTTDVARSLAPSLADLVRAFL